jgi:hypothetical protein
MEEHDGAEINEGGANPGGVCFVFPYKRQPADGELRMEGVTEAV